jgi:hypothetical protein
MHLCNLLHSMGFQKADDTPVYEDNMACIEWETISSADESVLNTLALAPARAVSCGCQWCWVGGWVGGGCQVLGTSAKCLALWCWYLAAPAPVPATRYWHLCAKHLAR